MINKESERRCGELGTREPFSVTISASILLAILLSGCVTDSSSSRYIAAAKTARDAICEKGALSLKEYASNAERLASVHPTEVRTLIGAQEAGYSIKPVLGSAISATRRMRNKISRQARMAPANRRFYVGAGDVEFQLNNKNVENLETVREIAFSIAGLKARREIASQLSLSVISKDESRLSNSTSNTGRTTSVNVSANLFGVSLIGISEAMPTRGKPYQLAVVLVWSPRLEILTRSALLGCFGELNMSVPRNEVDRLVDSKNIGPLLGTRTLIGRNGYPWMVSLGALSIDRTQKSIKGGMIFSKEASLKRLTTSLVGAVSIKSKSTKHLQRNATSIHSSRSMLNEMETYISRIFVPGVERVAEGVIEAKEGHKNKYFYAYTVNPGNIKFNELLLKKYFPGLADIPFDELMGFAGS